MKKSTTPYFVITAFLLIVFDQITKLLVKGFNFFGIEHKGFYYGESIPVIGDFLMFTFVENPGMAFGIEFGTGKIFLSLFSVLASMAIGWYMIKMNGFNSWARTGVMLIFSGAVGNMIDRVFYGVIFKESALFYGKVVDFIQVDIPDVDFFGLSYSHWPVFNIADSCVTVGVVILLFVHEKLPSINEIRGIKESQETEEIEVVNESDNESDLHNDPDNTNPN